MKNKIIFLIIFLYATINSVKANTSFYENFFGARAAGMAGAYTALGEGPESVFYNWAKPADLDKFYIKFEPGSWLETPYIMLSAQNILDIYFIKLGYIYSFVNDIPYTSLNDLNQPQDLGNSFSCNSHGFYAAMHLFSLWGFNFGIGGNIFYERLEKETAKGGGVGAAISKDWKIFNMDIATAVNVRNIYSTGYQWSTGVKDNMPYHINAGVNFKPIGDKLNIAVDLNSKLNKGDTLKKENVKYSLGAEYWILGDTKHAYSFTIRSGINEGSFALGCGFYLNGLMLDYAGYYPVQTYRDVNHRISVGLSLHQFIPNVIARERVIITSSGSLVDTKAVQLLEEELKLAKQEYIKPSSLVVAGNLGFDFAHNVLFFSNLDIPHIAKVSVNGKEIDIKENKETYQIAHNFDSNILTIIMYLKNSNKIISLYLEKYGDNLVMQGFMPGNMQININERPVEKQMDNSIMFKENILGKNYVAIDFFINTETLETE